MEITVIPYMLKIVERKREFAPDQLKSEQYRILEAKCLKARAVVSARGKLVGVTIPEILLLLFLPHLPCDILHDLEPMSFAFLSVGKDRSANLLL